MIINTITKGILSLIQSKLSKSGGTMTGPLYLSGQPSTNLQAATKGYADTKSPIVIPVVSITNDTVLTSSHCGRHLVCAGSSNVQFIVPGGLFVGWNCTIENISSGSISIASDNYLINGESNKTVYVGPRYKGSVSVIILTDNDCSIQGGLL